jgi:4-hydroxybenzoate polyprenyltransferase
MKSNLRTVARLFFLAGFGVVLIGMVSEFLFGAVLPSEFMQGIYVNGGFLIIIILSFSGGLLLIRRGLLGKWYYRYDSIIYVIAAIISFASAAQTLTGFQIGHPWLDLVYTNPVLMNLLWIFVLPPLNPGTMILIGTGFLILAWLNGRACSGSEIGLEDPDEELAVEKPPRWWELLPMLIRISVWLGAVFLVILSFLILGGPPLSPAPYILLYQPIMWLRLLFGVGAVVILNSAAFVLNQIGDVDTDQLNSKKARLPVAAGWISRKQAALLAIVFLILGVLLGFSVGPLFVGIAGSTFLFAILYSFPPIRLKARPFLDLFIIGLAFGAWAVLTAWTILVPFSFSLIPLWIPVIPFTLLFGAGLFYAGTHSIHTAFDYTADTQAGVTTTAVFIGPKKSARLGIFLIALGLLLLYVTIGFYTHLFWFGLLKYKTIFLLVFLGFPFFALFERYRVGQQEKNITESSIMELHQQGRWVTYLLFLILLIYLLFYIFFFYPIYYPHYFFPWI